MECAQKHVALVTQQVDIAQQILNDKINIIDNLSASAKKRVNAEHNRIIAQANAEREQAYTQIEQIAAQQKEQIQNTNGQLNELPLDEVSDFIQSMTDKMEYINETNNHLFSIETTLPKIYIRQRKIYQDKKL